MIQRLLVHRQNWNDTAVIEADREFSYGALMAKSLALRVHLPRGRREAVAILLPDGGEYVAAFWGTIQAGMTAFPLNPLMTAREIAPLLRQTSAGTVVTSAAFRPLMDEIAASEVVYIDEIQAHADGGDLAALEHVPEHDPEVDPEVAPEEPMVLLATSGTTGRSKIVVLSERNVEASMRGYMENMRFGEPSQAGSRFALAVPFSSAYGLMMLSVCLMHSFPVVLTEQPFTLNALYKAAERHRVTHYEGGASPIFLMEQLAGRHIPYDVSSLKYIGFGGSKVSGATIESVRNAYPGMEVQQGYGMTEASPLIARHPRSTRVKPDSVGIAIPGVTIAVETEAGITAAPNTMGEVVVRGPSVMLGYHRDEAETRRALKDGYLHTGDVGYLDEDGYLYICGRKKNVIIVRGFNVYPEEVESCIQNSLHASDCVVYGQADSLGNELVCADVVPSDPSVTAGQIAAHCRAHLAEYKRPQRIAICQSVRKNASGKTERRGGDAR